MPTNKAATSYRLSDEAQEILERQAKRLGVARTAVLEMALRMLEEKLGPAPAQAEPPQSGA